MWHTGFNFQPEISVVMPTYNQGRYIRQAVESVMWQSWRLFELIVVDDASSDNTPDILMSLQRQYHNLRVIRRESNGGTGAALNTGFELATGRLETWFASDNVMYRDCLLAMRSYLLQHPDVDYVYSDAEIGVMEADGVTERNRRLLSSEVGGQEFSYDRLLWHYYLGICWLWRRDLRLRAGGLFQLEPCEDYDMVLRMAECGGKFANVPDVLGWFRRHDNNMTHKIRTEYADPDHYSILVKEKAAARRAGQWMR